MWSRSCSCSDLCSRNRSSRWGLSCSKITAYSCTKISTNADLSWHQDFCFPHGNGTSKFLVSGFGLCESQTRLHRYTGTESGAWCRFQTEGIWPLIRAAVTNTSVSADASVAQAQPCYLCVVHTVHGIVRCLPLERFPLSWLWIQDFKSTKRLPEVTVV